VEDLREAARDDPRSRIVVLPDGRGLGYAEWGAPSGWPVLFFHGTPASRLGLEWADDTAIECGVRVLSLDRPGHGLSDRAPGRTLLGWSRDVADFADVVGLTTFAIAGWSGGGPYVLACAAGIPERLTGAAVLSGIGPFDKQTARRSVSSIDRTMLRLSRRAPLAARVMMKPVVVSARRVPRLAVRSIEQELSSSDRATFRRLNPDPRSAIAFFLEAFRSGTAGVVDDYRVLASPWGFAPEDIEMPVQFWHGDADRMAGFAEARAIAARMPNARFNLVPGEGHLLLMDHLRDIFASLAP
jgi:pimeloyl-ACP methyl ester carboxylesterase